MKNTPKWGKDLPPILGKPPSKEELNKQMLGEFSPHPMSIDEALALLQHMNGRSDELCVLTRWISFVRYNSKDAAHMADQYIGVKDEHNNRP